MLCKIYQILYSNSVNVIFAGIITKSQYCINVKTVIKATVTDSGYNNSWHIGCVDQYCQICVNNQEYRWSGEYNQECCFLEDYKEYIIKCYDYLKDGWHGGYLEINGVKYCEDFLEGYMANYTMTKSNTGINLCVCS